MLDLPRIPHVSTYIDAAFQSSYH